MNDCTNAQMRDQLPDLLHERLDALARAAVLAHVDGCVDCRDELQLLRDVHVVLVQRTPRIDVNRVVQALPKPPARTLRLEPRRRTWSDWRVAAAVTLLVAGGGSYALMHSTNPVATPHIEEPMVIPPVASNTASVAPAAHTNANAAKSVAAPEKPRAVAAATEDAATADLGADNRLGDLSEEQLQTLLNDIGNLRAVPAAEPEPVSLRVKAKVGSSGDA